MNRDDPSLARFLNLSERYDLGGDLLVLVEGPEQLMDEAASGLLDILRGLPSVRIAGHAIPRNWMADHSPWLVERALFDSWLAAVRDPTRIDDLRAELEALLEALGSVDDSIFEGRRLLFVRLDEDPLEMSLADSAFFELESSVQAAVADSP